MNDVGSVTGTNGACISSRHSDTVLVPDVAAVRWERWPGRELPNDWPELASDLVVEIESPTFRPLDLGRKRDLYARAGVTLLWWVDPEARTVTINRLGQAPVVLYEAGVLDGDEALPGLGLPVAKVSA